MIELRGNCSENLIASNHLLRDHEPWPPMQAHDNGLDDLYGLVYVNGNDNSILANHISEVMEGQFIKPEGARPVMIHVVSGKGNYISNNHITASAGAAEEPDAETDSCFARQVDALLTVGKLKELPVVTVLVEKEAVGNTVLDTGSEEQVVMDRKANAFRAAPVPGIVS